MANSKIKAAFEPQVLVVPIETIKPQRELPRDARLSVAYKRVWASIGLIGQIEPLVVFPRKPDDYLLLDGHVRLDVLKSNGATDARVLFALDDEAYTYNTKVNHVYSVAEHFMILKALSSGVGEDRIALALNVNVAAIRAKRDMLDGICTEVVNMLRNKDVRSRAFAILKKMKPARQIEAAEYMSATNNYSAVFAESLLVMTHPDSLADAPPKKPPETCSAAAQIMLEQETDSLLDNLKTVEQSYGTDVLTLSISCGYIIRLLRNAKVERHLEKHHPDILTELRALLSEVKPDKVRALSG